MKSSTSELALKRIIWNGNFLRGTIPNARRESNEEIWPLRGFLTHWKLERFVSALKCQFSPAGQNLIQPFLEPFEHNLGQKSSIKRLFQPTVGPILALGPNQPSLIGLYWPWFKGAKLDPKIGPYFTHRNGPVFRAKTDLPDLECSFTVTDGSPPW